LYDHRKLSTQVSSSIEGLVSYFCLSDRKKSRRSRITSVVFNRHGTEILASYSSESIYLLDPKRIYSQEQMNDILIEHRKNKENKRKTYENKSTVDRESQISQIKRSRLKTNEEQTENDTSQNPQNFWMQRMSDILTQLVTRTTAETEEVPTTRPTEDSNSSDSNTNQSQVCFFVNSFLRNRISSFVFSRMIYLI